MTIETDLPHLLERARAGDPDALNEMLIRLQVELRKIVSACRRRGPDISLRTTEVFHEAYLKLFRSETPGFSDAEHLLAMWANAARWVIVEAWRRKGRRPDLDALVDPALSSGAQDSGASPDAILAAFEALKAEMPREGLVAELRLLHGLSTAQIAEGLGYSQPTVRRWVHAASVWIRLHVEEGDLAS